MLLELASSTEPQFFRNTVVGFRINSGPIQVLRSGECEQLTLVSLLEVLVRSHHQRGPLEIRAPENTLTQPFEKKWHGKWVKENFTGKTPQYRDEWKALTNLFEEKGIVGPIIMRNDEAAHKALKDAIREERTGRKRQSPLIHRPGDPDENPWTKSRETLGQYLARKNHKD